MKLVILSVFLFPLTVQAEERYQFPKGVPVDSAAVTWYTATDHYQIVNEVSYGVFSRFYNISAAKPRERFGNANLEFPWRTGGMDDSPNGVSFKFHHFPKGGTIHHWLDRGWSETRIIGGTRWGLSQKPGLIRWRYPDGTVFGEVLQVDRRTFEIRTMEKVKGKWEFKTYRPWSKKEDIPKPKSEKKKVERLFNRHPVTVFDEVTGVEEIESSPEDVVFILSRDFLNVTDAGYCPTASKKGQIVPINYKGAFLHKDSCVKCHDTVGKSVNEFEPRRDWYGQTRGSDSVFSFSIFDESCVSKNGFNHQPVLRKDLPLARKDD